MLFKHEQPVSMPFLSSPPIVTTATVIAAAIVPSIGWNTTAYDGKTQQRNRSNFQNSTNQTHGTLLVGEFAS